MPNSFQVLFGDEAQPADAEFYDLLTSLEVEENADLPGAIQLTLPISTTDPAGSEDITIVDDDRFKPYARIGVLVSLEGQSDACIFDGYVLSHRVHHDAGTTSASAQVWGQDASCLMNMEEKTREWKDTDGTIANTIFKDYNFTSAAGNTEHDSGAHAESAHTVMQRGTDAQFLRDRARRAGKLFRVCCDQQAGQNTGYFVTPTLDGAAVLTLALNPADESNIDALDFEWDVSRPTEAAAKALVLTKDAVDGTATQSGLPLLDTRSLSSFANGPHPMKTLLTATVDDAGELRSRAESVLREASWFVRCEGEADPSRLQGVMRVGTVVQVNGAGRLHSGKYFVWSVRHTITAESHRMKFVLMRNAVGAT